MTDDLDDLLEGEDEGEGAAGDSADGESPGDKDPKSSDKRIRDLQSAKDKETARANKAEKQLKAFLDAANGSDAEAGNGEPSAPSNAANDAVLDMARMLVMQQQPKLEAYGISASDLNGSTPAEIAATASALVAQFEKFETQARNQVLAEQGLAPEIDAGGSGAPKPSRDYSKMPKEEFEKVYEQAMKTPPRS